MNYPMYPSYNPQNVPSFSTGPMGAMPTSQPMGSSAYQQPSMPSTICRPVASREEAVGVPVDFMGSLMVFPDLGHGRVYLKRFNNQTGSADFMEFVPAPSTDVVEGPEPVDEIKEIKDQLAELISLPNQIAELSKKIDSLKPEKTKASQASGG